MDPKGVTAGASWMRARCPYCMEKLGIKEKLKRRIQKKCRCRKCGRQINEGHIIW